MICFKDETHGLIEDTYELCTKEMRNKTIEPLLTDDE